MKKRLFFLTASLLFAVLSFAQPVVTVEKLWSGDPLGWNTGNSRQWAGHGEFVYWADKATHAIYGTNDGQQAETIIQNDLIDGVGFCVDEAGNWVVSGGFPGVPSHLFLVKHTDTTFVNISLSLPASYTKRTDMISATGNVFSNEGGFVYIYGNEANMVIVVIKNAGTPEQEVTYKEIAIQGSNVQNYVVAGDTTIQYVQRRSKGQTGFEKFVDGVNMGSIAGMPGYKATTLGGAIVTLAGQDFAIYPSGSVNYSSEFSISNLTAGELVGSGYCANTTTAANNTNVGVFVNATKIDDYSAYIQVGNGSDGTALFKMTVPRLYEIGDNLGWNPTVGQEMELVGANIYKGYFDFEANQYFAFVTDLAENNDQGGWDYINTLRYASVEDQEVADGSVVELVKANRSIKITEAGKYAITVNGNTNQISVVKIMVEQLFEIGDNQGAWHANVGIPMTKVADNIFEGEFTFNNAENYFAFATEMANDDDDNAWDWFNNNVRYAGSEANKVVDDATATSVVKGNQSFKLLPGTYKFRVDMHEGTLNVTQSVAKVIVGDAGYATYFNGTKGYTMPENLTGYTYVYPGDGLVERFTEGQNVPTGVALVLGGVAGTYDLVLKSDVEPILGLQNKLRGTDVKELTTAPGEGVYLFYGLSLDETNDVNLVGFYWMVENGAAFENEAHKAYLALEENSMAPARILFNENGATNIEELEANETVVKFIKNGQLYIQKNGVVYNAIGAVVK